MRRAVAALGAVLLLATVAQARGPWWQRGQQADCEECPTCEVCVEKVCPAPPVNPFVRWRKLSIMRRQVESDPATVSNCLAILDTEDIVCGRDVER